MADFDIERPTVEAQNVQPTYNINPPQFTIEIPGGFQGQRGEKGDTGAPGRDGVDGTNGQDGQDGVSVTSIEQTTTSTESGGTNIITATLSNGDVSTFEIMNGEAGASGGITLEDPVIIQELENGVYSVPPGINIHGCSENDTVYTTTGNATLVVTHTMVPDQNDPSITYDSASYFGFHDSVDYTYDDYGNFCPSANSTVELFGGVVCDDDGSIWTFSDKDIRAALTSGDVINNLTTNSTTKPLSAAQGKILKGMLDDVLWWSSYNTVNDPDYEGNVRDEEYRVVDEPYLYDDDTYDYYINTNSIMYTTDYSNWTKLNDVIASKQNEITALNKLDYSLIDNQPTIPTALSDLSDDTTHRLVTDTEKSTWSGKQDALVSGTNIKTINNNSLLGSGNITISGGGGTATDVQINGNSIVVSDVANILTETAYNSSTNKIATMSDVPDTSSFIDKDVNNLTNYSLTTTLQANKSLTKGVEYIVGTQGSATNLWTGTSTDTGCSSGTLYTGKVIIYHLPQAGTSTAATLNLTLPDGTTTGAKSVYRLASTTTTTNFVAGCDILMVYDGAHWKVNAYVDTSGSNTIGYQLRTNYGVYYNGASTSIYRYQLLVETKNGLEPFTSTSNKTGTTKTQLDPHYIPGGDIRYYSSTTEITAGSEIGKTSIWQQYQFDLRYSFNITSTTLTSGKPVYMKMSRNNDGTLSAVYSSASGGHPITQTLPTTEDNYIYMFLGEAYNGYQIELNVRHPLYEFKNGRLREYVDATGGTITETDPVFTSSAAYGITSSDITNWNNKSITDLSSTVILNDIDSGIYRLAKGTVLKYKESDDDSNPSTLTTVNKSALMMFNIKVDSGYPLFSYIILQDDHDGTYSSMDNTFELDVGSNSHIMSGCMSPYTGDTWNEKDLYIYNILDLNSIVDNLTSSYTTRPLSAKQGKVLKDAIDAITIPTVNDSTITIQKNGTNVDSFTTNASSNKSINITVPTKTSELTNNSGFITNSVNNLTNYTLTSSLATVATSGSYNDLSNKPTIPTITLSTTTWVDSLF